MTVVLISESRKLKNVSFVNLLSLYVFATDAAAAGAIVGLIVDRSSTGLRSCRRR